MEKEVELVHKMNRELGEINQKIASVADKFDEHYQDIKEIHSQNRQDILTIKNTTENLDVKVGIQNGRVTKNEKETIELQKGMAEMMKIISLLHGDLVRRNKIGEEEYEKKKKNEGKILDLKYSVWTKVAYVIIGIVSLSVLQLLFPRVEVVNLLKLIN